VARLFAKSTGGDSVMVALTGPCTISREIYIAVQHYKNAQFRTNLRRKINEHAASQCPAGPVIWPSRRFL